MRKNVVIFVGIIGVAFGSGAWSASDDIPRVLMAGDSWPGFMHLFRCFDTAFNDTPGLERWGERGSLTCEFGIRAPEYAANYLDDLTAELTAYPTIDIVHLSLGGNDFLYSGWTPSMTPAQVDALVASVNAQTEAVIDHILSIRPNIRVVLCGYSFASHEISGATAAQINAAQAAFEITRKDLCLSKARTYYVNNLGLVQYYYGIPEASIAPTDVPFPGGYWSVPQYDPMPGGNPAYAPPEDAFVDKDIHLQMTGYDYVAANCVDEFYAAWLALPVVLEILPLSATQFRVTFSEDVINVDAADFAVNGGGAGVNITGVSGGGAVYTVATSVSGGALEVLDDDSIVDGSSNPLGGTGAGNGGFTYNGALKYADPVLAKDDFDSAMTSVNESFRPVAWMLGGESFAPSDCDLNGGAISVNPPDITGNGMLDSCELGLIAACLQDGSLDLSGTNGVTHDEVQAAWDRNIAQIGVDLGGANGRMAQMVPGVDSLMAGLMTLGDSNSMAVPILLVLAIKAVLELPPGVAIPSPVNYTLLGDYFGPNGDADGDGYTNRQEYEYAMPLGGRALYTQVALNPAIAAGTDCDNHTGGTYTEGDAFCLSLPEPVDLNASFQWYKDGQPLASEGFVSGTQYRELHISYLLVQDSGEYTCQYDDGTKAPQTFGPVTLVVEPVNSSPALSGWGMAALSLAVVVAGGVVFRRRHGASC